MKRAKILAPALLLVLGTACDGFGLGQPEGALLVAVDAPTWEEHIAPMMDTHCNECHAQQAAEGAPDYFRLDTLEDEGEKGLRSYALSSLNRMVDTPAKPMPTLDRPPMSEAEIETFARWIELGAPVRTGDTGLVW